MMLVREKGTFQHFPSFNAINYSKSSGGVSVANGLDWFQSARHHLIPRTKRETVSWRGGTPLQVPRRRMRSPAFSGSKSRFPGQNECLENVDSTVVLRRVLIVLISSGGGGLGGALLSFDTMALEFSPFF